MPAWLRILTLTFGLCAIAAPAASAKPYPETIPLPNGSKGRTLFVVQNPDNKIAVVHLRFLCAVNARFTTPPMPDTTYDVVRVTR